MSLWNQFVSGLLGNSPKARTNDEFVQLFLTRLEDRRVLNAAPVDTQQQDPGLAVAEAEPLTVSAGLDANDARADLFHLVREGDQAKLYLNGREVYSGS